MRNLSTAPEVVMKLLLRFGEMQLLSQNAAEQQFGGEERVCVRAAVLVLLILSY